MQFLISRCWKAVMAAQKRIVEVCQDTFEPKISTPYVLI